jgi:hypothetical protein
MLLADGLGAPPIRVMLGHVWTRPSFLRCQRDQDRVRHSAGAADSQYRAKLEPGADRPRTSSLASRPSTPGPRRSTPSRPSGEAFRQRRCLVLLDGFYEWKKTAPGKQPYAIALADRRFDGHPRAGRRSGAPS